jgi:hypothetical protein
MGTDLLNDQHAVFSGLTRSTIETTQDIINIEENSAAARFSLQPLLEQQLKENERVSLHASLPCCNYKITPSFT